MQNSKRVLTGLMLLSFMLSSMVAMAQPGPANRGQRPERGPGMMWDSLMERLQESEEGLSYDAVREILPNMPEMMFERLDADSDGKLTEKEFEAAIEMRRERMEQRRDERPRAGRSGPETQRAPRGDRPRAERSPREEGRRSARVDKLSDEERAQFRAGVMWGRILERADKDKTRRITRKEFKAAFPNLPEGRFDVFDHDGDGVLTYWDIQGHLQDKALPRLWQRNRSERPGLGERPRDRSERPGLGERPRDRSERPRRAE